MLTVPKAVPVKLTMAKFEFGTVAGDQFDAVFQSVPGPAQVWAALGWAVITATMKTAGERIAVDLLERVLIASLLRKCPYFHSNG
jgi:hypothetical protein